MSQEKQAAIPATPLLLYPSMQSLQQVIDYAESKLPITDKNELVSILGIYHNTLLDQVRNCK